MTERLSGSTSPGLSPSPIELNWLGVELRHLAAFEMVIEVGSFNKAAHRLGYTQSAVSQQIRALERIIGHRLLNRRFGRERVSLTPAGERIAGHIRELLTTLAAAEADLAAFSSGKAGSLIVGTYQSVSARVIPHVVREFSRHWPGIEIRLSEVLAERGLFTEVRQGAVELTFGTAPVPPGPFAAVELLRDEYVLLLPSAWSVEFARPPGGKQITRFPLLGCHCPSFAAVEAYLRASGGEPNVVFRSDDNMTLHALVAAGVGAALMPRLAVDHAQPGIRLVELETTVPARTIILAWNSERALSPATSTLIKVAKDVCRGLTQEQEREAVVHASATRPSPSAAGDELQA